MATADLDAYISGKVASGEFESEEEFLREAAQVYRELEEHYRELSTTIQARIRQAAAGDMAALDFEAIKAEGRRRLSATLDLSQYEPWEPPFDEAELRRREQSGERRYTTAEVLEHLERL